MRSGCSVADAMDQREPDIIAHRMKAPDLVDGDLIFFAKTPRDIYHGRRHIQMEGNASSSELSPFGKRFEMIHRLAGFHLDDGLKPPAIGRVQDEVGINRRGSVANGNILLGARIDTSVVFAPVVVSTLRMMCRLLSAT